MCDGQRTLVFCPYCATIWGLPAAEFDGELQRQIGQAWTDGQAEGQFTRLACAHCAERLAYADFLSSE